MISCCCSVVILLKVYGGGGRFWCDVSKKGVTVVLILSCTCKLIMLRWQQAVGSTYEAVLLLEPQTCWAMSTKMPTFMFYDCWYFSNLFIKAALTPDTGSFYLIKWGRNSFIVKQPHGYSWLGVEDGRLPSLRKGSIGILATVAIVLMLVDVAMLCDREELIDQ